MNRILGFLFFMLILAGLAFSMLKNLRKAAPLAEPAVVAGQPLTIVAGDWRDDPFLVRFSVDGDMSGFAGCNRISGTYIATDTTLRIDDIVSTDKHCDTDVSEAEAEFIAALGATTRYRISGVTLLLRDATATRLVLTYGDASPANRK